MITVILLPVHNVPGDTCVYSCLQTIMGTSPPPLIWTLLLFELITL